MEIRVHSLVSIVFSVGCSIFGQKNGYVIPGLSILHTNPHYGKYQICNFAACLPLLNLPYNFFA